jgi:hypothetical protein
MFSMRTSRVCSTGQASGGTEIDIRKVYQSKAMNEVDAGRDGEGAEEY